MHTRRAGHCCGVYRRDLLGILGTGALASAAGCTSVLSGRGNSGDDLEGHPAEEVIGVSHLDGRYHFTDEPYLEEGANVVRELGSNVLKLWLDFPQWYYHYNHDWAEDYDTKIDVALEPSFQRVFEMPFSTYVLKTTANHRYPPNYFREGVDDWEAQQERERFEAITRHFLETYDGTGKTFVLQYREGDYWVVPEHDPARAPTDTAWEGMRRWYRARQTGVRRGREAVDSDVTVLHAAEPSIVLDAKQYGRSRVANEVLPEVELDMVSYSSYELGGQISGNAWLPSQNPQEQYDEADTLVRETLSYIADMHTPTGYADRVLSAEQEPVFLGEIGVPLQEVGEEQGMRTLRALLEPSLEWGVRWAIWWQVFDNELASGEDPDPEDVVTENEAVRGFHLVRPDGSRAPTWEYFRGLFADDGQN